MRIYKANEVDDQRFYKIPKSLFGNELYKGLSLESKVLYSFLRDRMELSKVNGWINEQGEVYLIFVRENIAKLLETSLPTITKSFKQLIKYELIFEKRQGQGKPNLIFVCHIELTPVIAEKQNILVSGYKENLHQDTKKVCTNDTDFNNTDKNDTDNNGDRFLKTSTIDCFFNNIESDVHKVISLYYSEYKRYRMKDHPKLKPDQFKNVIDNIQSFMVEHNFKYYEMEGIVEQHFTRNIKTDYNINHFATEGILLNSLYEVM